MSGRRLHAEAGPEAAAVRADLMEIAFGGDAAGPTEPPSMGPALRELGAAPPGLVVPASGPALAIGVAWALRDAARTLGAIDAQVDMDVLVDLLRWSPPPAPEPGWAGFVDAGDGWVSLALGQDSIAVWREFRRQAPSGAEATAAAAQDWGLACLPAPVGRLSGDPGRPAGRRPRASPRAALGLRPGPLVGLRVLDLGVLVAAPVLAQILADLGADVVSAAHPNRAGSRWYGPPPRRLDLRDSADREAFAGLCRWADVVVDNYSPRVLPGFGLDPIALGARTHLSLPAFPAGHPRRDHRAYGFQTAALLGCGAAPSPSAVAPVPAPPGAPMDHVVGMAGAVRCLAMIAAGVAGRREVTHHEVGRLGTAIRRS